MRFVQRVMAMVVWVGVAGCGDAVAEHQELQAALDDCGYTTCGWHHPGYEDGQTVKCMLERARDGSSGHLEVSVAGDGADCGNVYDLYLGTDGVVFRLLRTDLACDESVSLERCRVVDESTLLTCIEQLETFEPEGPFEVAPCGNMSDWLVDCQPVDEASCS